MTAADNVIRPATEAELGEIATLVAVGWREAYRTILPPALLDIYSASARRESLLRSAWESGALILVAIDENGRIVGTVSDRCPPRLPGCEAEIDALYVEPGAMGGGVGRALIVALRDVFLARGCRSMRVHTFEQNLSGRGFYERLGGKLHAKDDWEGYSCVWYVWDFPAMMTLQSRPPSLQ